MLNLYTEITDKMPPDAQDLCRRAANVYERCSDPTDAAKIEELRKRCQAHLEEWLEDGLKKLGGELP